MRGEYYLARQRMDAVGGVTDEDGAGPDVSVRVTKAQGEGGTMCHTCIIRITHKMLGGHSQSSHL